MLKPRIRKPEGLATLVNRGEPVRIAEIHYKAGAIDLLSVPQLREARPLILADANARADATID